MQTSKSRHLAPTVDVGRGAVASWRPKGVLLCPCHAPHPVVWRVAEALISNERNNDRTLSEKNFVYEVILVLRP